MYNWINRYFKHEWWYNNNTGRYHTYYYRYEKKLNLWAIRNTQLLVERELKNRLERICTL